jgi:hypothetical protein
MSLFTLNEDEKKQAAASYVTPLLSRMPPFNLRGGPRLKEWWPPGTVFFGNAVFWSPHHLAGLRIIPLDDLPLNRVLPEAFSPKADDKGELCGKSQLVSLSLPFSGAELVTLLAKLDHAFALRKASRTRGAFNDLRRAVEQARDRRDKPDERDGAILAAFCRTFDGTGRGKLMDGFELKHECVLTLDIGPLVTAAHSCCQCSEEIIRHGLVWTMGGMEEPEFYINLNGQTFLEKENVPRPGSLEDQQPIISQMASSCSFHC